MVWLFALPIVWWAALLLGDSIIPGRNLMELLPVLTEKLNHPFQIHWTEYTVKCLFLCTLLYGMGVGIFCANQKNYRRGEEHGSAKWGDVGKLCKKYRDMPYAQNILLTQNFRIGLNCYKHRRNLNILVIGGSGAGKSRTFAIPNIMQCNCSMVITDPKAGARRSCLKRTGTAQT